MKRGNSIDQESNHKRTRTDAIIPEQAEQSDRIITSKFIKKCKHDFDLSTSNILARNAVTSVGAFNAAINVEEENKISHIFLNTLKPWHLKATNQGHSGRCWMFAGLNIFRYILTNLLNVVDFEFSES